MEANLVERGLPSKRANEVCLVRAHWSAAGPMSGRTQETLRGVAQTTSAANKLRWPWLLQSLHSRR
jgi:hypothetical protein